MKRIPVFILMIFFAFSSCKDSEKQKTEVEVQSEVEKDADLVISDGKVGNFSLGAPVPQSFDNFEFHRSTETRMAEGMSVEEEILTISRNGEEKLLLKPQSDPKSEDSVEIISEIIVLSEDFKTDKGIGVNSTLEEFQKAYPDHKIWFTYVSDRYILETPTLDAQFFLKEEDFTGEMEINSAQVPLKASDFKEGAKIQKIRLFE